MLQKIENNQDLPYGICFDTLPQNLRLAILRELFFHEILTINDEVFILPYTMMKFLLF